MPIDELEHYLEARSHLWPAIWVVLLEPWDMIVEDQVLEGLTIHLESAVTDHSLRQPI